jgi:hypothetical protein
MRLTSFVKVDERTASYSFAVARVLMRRRETFELISDEYLTGKGTEAIGCYDSPETLDKVAEAIDKHDDEGFQDLSAGVPVLHSGTRVRVLDFDLFKGYLSVRVRSGDHAGEKCWLLTGSQNDAGNGPMLAKKLTDNS